MEFHQLEKDGYSSKDNPTRKISSNMIVVPCRFIGLSLLLYRGANTPRYGNYKLFAGNHALLGYQQNNCYQHHNAAQGIEDGGTNTAGLGQFNASLVLD